MIKQYLVHYKYKTSGELFYNETNQFVEAHDIKVWWEEFSEEREWKYRDLTLLDISYLGVVNDRSED